ncbi:MAG: twin-arginine translocation signal domain-containing protein [Anaerolineae bacterium]|nr:twin-arginine translocation signal domain-containing protein [Anaerolineae bacterium]
MKSSISRRTFLKTAGFGAGAMALAACGAASPSRRSPQAWRGQPTYCRAWRFRPSHTHLLDTHHRQRFGHAEELQRDDVLPGVGED